MNSFDQRLRNTKDTQRIMDMLNRMAKDQENIRDDYFKKTTKEERLEELYAWAKQKGWVDDNRRK